MPIVSKTGSKYLNEDQLTPDQLKKVETTKSFDERLLARNYTSDTFNTRTALNLSRMSPIVEALGKLASGAPIYVTYFSQILNHTNKRSNPSDYSSILNDVHKAFSKIEKMEIRLNGPLTFNYVPEDNESEVEGTGKILPGFPCNVGDVFLYEVSPAQIGLFVVSDLVPLSLHRGSFSEITFFLKEWATNEQIEKFDQCTYEVFHYATQSVFGESRVLLKREDYFNFLALINLRIDLIKLYDKLYYSKDDETFFRPDAVYDPYMVQFVNKILQFDDTPYYPYRQLMEERIYDKESVLMDLLGGKQRFNFTTIQKCSVLTHVLGALSVGLNNMLQKRYVILEPMGESNYMGFSNEFVLRQETLITDTFELILFNYLKTKTIDSNAIITYINTLGTIPDMMRFYAIPILIFMCNKGITTMGA